MAGRLNNHPEVTEPDRGNTTDTYIEEFDRQQYQIIIENMEKDLGSLTIVQFIYEQIHLTPEVYIVPSFLTHFHPSGIVIVNGREELKKLSSFLSNPDHMIISPRGRYFIYIYIYLLMQKIVPLLVKLAKVLNVA